METSSYVEGSGEDPEFVFWVILAGEMAVTKTPEFRTNCEKEYRGMRGSSRPNKLFSEPVAAYRRQNRGLKAKATRPVKSKQWWSLNSGD